MLIIHPASILDCSATYIVTVPAAAVNDGYGTPLNQAYTSRFTTLAPQRVIISNPEDGWTNVPVTTSVIVSFYDLVLPGPNSTNITLRRTTDGALVPISKTLDNRSLIHDMFIIDPINDLDYGTAYTVTIPRGAVTDWHGGLLDYDYTTRFTTEDIVKIIATNPPDHGPGYPVSTAVTIYFNKAINASVNYSNIILRETSSNATVSATKEIVNVNGQFMLVVNPTANLTYYGNYSLYVPSGAVADAHDAPLTHDFATNFTTGGPISPGGAPRNYGIQPPQWSVWKSIKHTGGNRIRFFDTAE